MAKQKAEALLRDEGLTSLPIDPTTIAARRDIEVRAKPEAAEGVSGMLLRHGSNFGILYATHIPSEGFQRFSVSHELGHFFLEGHIDHVLPSDGMHTSHAGFVSADPFELEADNFASGLLMPSAPFKKAMGQHDAGLELVESLAGLCRTSLPATGIRYAELCEDAVAVIVSTGPTINYCCLSDTMKSLPRLDFLRNGSPVPGGTATEIFNKDPKRITDGLRDDREMNIRDWLGGERSMRAIEQVLGLGRYGKTLTVLTCPGLVEETYDEDEGDDEEQLMRHWEPKFHK
jgi:hypothetical protein